MGCWIELWRGGRGRWRGVELRREQRRDGAVVKVDSRRGGVVER